MKLFPLLLSAFAVLFQTGILPARAADEIRILSPSVIAIGDAGETDASGAPQPERAGYIPHLPPPPGTEMPAPRPKVVANPPVRVIPMEGPMERPMEGPMEGPMEEPLQESTQEPMQVPRHDAMHEQMHDQMYGEDGREATE